MNIWQGTFSCSVALKYLKPREFTDPSLTSVKLKKSPTPPRISKASVAWSSIKLPQVGQLLLVLHNFKRGHITELKHLGLVLLYEYQISPYQSPTLQPMFRLWLTAGQLTQSCSNCDWLELSLSNPQQFSWLSRSILVLFTNIPHAELKSASW